MSLKDRVAFVGRSAELASIDELLVDDPAASVVLVHGPGGIGKSALLRELGRRARPLGRSVVSVEGRDLPPLPDALEEAVAPAQRAQRPLVLVDSYEHMAALGSHLRRAVLPSLPDDALVVIAGRRPPDRGWFEGGWELLVREVELGPLSPADSLELLQAHGLTDPARAAEATGWAAGSPLALTLLARFARTPEWRRGLGSEPREVVRTLVRRLIDLEYDGPQRDVLWLACLARVATTHLIRDVLPELDAGDTMRWLAGCSFTEPLADGITLHDLVRRALRSDLRQREPEHERDLRRRIADSLHARAVAGRPLLTIDLAELIEAPQLRALYSWEGATHYRIDAVRDGDTDQVAQQLAASGRGDRWASTRPFFELAPETVAIVRDSGGAVHGYSIATTLTAAPPVAYEDPVLGRWLHHARQLTPEGSAILCRDATDFTGDPRSGVEAMIHVSIVLRSGSTNPRYLYLPIVPERQDVLSFTASLGMRHIPELVTPLSVDPERTECHLLDCGPGGVFGLQRDLVYRELGLAPRALVAAAPPPEPPTETAPDRTAVRKALRNLRQPLALAQSPLAVGDQVDDRAASVRRLLQGAAESAFGDTDDERLLRRVLIEGYFDRSVAHEQSARRLNLSRSAYFRRLRRASERVTDYLTGRWPPPPKTT